MSDIDPTVFRDDVKVNKADLREQFLIVKEEITDLQKVTELPRRMAFSNLDFNTL